MLLPHESPLMAAPSMLDLPALLGTDQVWTWRQVHQASIDLSQRLEGAAVCNLCSSRLGFLVTFLAALRAGCLLVLPPSLGAADLAASLQGQGKALLVVDDAQAITTLDPSIAPCIVCPPVGQAGKARDADLAWQPDWDAAAVLLYTSGSTGEPQPQRKTLRHLADGAQRLGARLSQDLEGGLASVTRIVCSVAPQHMFGLECSVMLPLLHALALLERRPLLPADVSEAFAQGPAGLWITTPLHMRALAQTGKPLANCHGVVASTMPLAQTLARETEALVQAPVLEIYGSTETGVLALRRTARETSWRPLEGVRLATDGGLTQAWGSHFASPVALPDEIEIDAKGNFVLLGRQADLLKIAGRRASLAGLNLLLQDLPGLQDGLLFLPAGADPGQRLCLIYTGPSLRRSEVLAWLRARLDPVFLPRALVRVPRLPRDGNGKLRRQQLDELYRQWRTGDLAAAPDGLHFSVPHGHPALAGHFPGRPIVPGVLLLDHVLAHAQATLGRRVTRLHRVKFIAPLLPDETAWLELESTGPRATFTVTAQRDGATLALASGSLQLGNLGDLDGLPAP